MSSTAVFSPCRRYRYSLFRQWSMAHGGFAAFIGLNPSTADETNDDPTIRRCVGFAKAWGFDALVMLNLFAFRATDPDEMRRADDPVGPENDEWIAKSVNGAGIIVAAWGTHGAFRPARVKAVRALVPTLYHLGLSKDGHPKHPLYLKASTVPKEWKP